MDWVLLYDLAQEGSPNGRIALIGFGGLFAGLAAAIWTRRKGRPFRFRMGMFLVFFTLLAIPGGLLPYRDHQRLARLLASGQALQLAGKVQHERIAEYRWTHRTFRRGYRSIPCKTFDIGDTRFPFCDDAPGYDRIRDGNYLRVTYTEDSGRPRILRLEQGVRPKVAAVP